jgi:Carbohydrate-selective porin, OprB family
VAMSRFLFNIGKTSSAVLAATLLLSSAATQAEAALNTASETGVQEGNNQLIARKVTRKVVKAKKRGTTTTVKKTTVITPSATQVTKETVVTTTTVATPAAPQTTEIAPPPPKSSPVQFEREEAVSQQDLDRLRGLVDSYRTDIEAVSSKADKAAKSGSFSTTTKLAGEVILGVSGYGGVTAAPAVAVVAPTATARGTTAVAARTETGGFVFADRVRLNFDTSFNGKDKLRTRLQSRNNTEIRGAATGTNMTRLGFDGGTDNSTSVSLLQYTYPLSPETTVRVETTGSEFNENMNTFNPLLASAGSGSISRFGRYNPIYRQSGDGAALTLNHKFSDNLDLAVGYAIPSGANTPGSNIGGLGNSSNAVIGQLSFKPTDDLSVGVAYARSYHADGTGVSGATGSTLANNPFNGNRTTASHYSVMASYKLGTSAVLSGWYGITDAKSESLAAGGASVDGSASSNNYAVSLAFPDFGNKGNTLGFIVGQSPKTTSLKYAGTELAADSASSLHLEALYKMKVSDSVDVTPGLMVITNPENNSANPTQYVGTVRTTFKF